MALILIVFQLQNPVLNHNDYPELAKSELKKAIWSKDLLTLYFRGEVGTQKEFVEIIFPFLEWLAPNVYPYHNNPFNGFFQSTDSEADYPHFIFFIDGKIYFNEVGNETTVEVNATNVKDFI